MSVTSSVAICKRWRLEDRRGVLQIIHQPTNALIKVQFITRIKLLHVSAPGNNENENRVEYVK
jgi:hypothetical protein